MSDLNLVRVIDPRLNINARANKQYGILSGAPQQTWKSFQSQNFDSSSISFNCRPPNINTYVNKKLYIEMKFRLTFNGVSSAPGQPLLHALGLRSSPGVSPGTGYYDAPRCLPLSRCFKTQAVELNNDNTTSNLAQYSVIFQRYGRSSKEENEDLSGSPAMPDKSQSYSDLDGFALNPLSGWGNNVTQTPRGGFAGAIVTSNTTTGVADTATVELTVIEPLWLSPFSGGSEEEEVALIQIQDLLMTFTLGGQGNGLLGGLASALWSHSPSSPSTFTSISAEVLAGTAYFNYLTPGLGQSIPRSINYSYYDPLVFNTTELVAVAPGVQHTMEMQTVTMKSVPNRMYIMMGKQDKDKTWEDTDTFFSIEQLNVTFGNRDGLLSNASAYDLYQMSVRNGMVNVSYDDWRYRTGSILCCSFGMDVPLEPQSAPGLRTAQNLQLRVTGTNISSQAVIPTLRVVVIQEGVMRIYDMHVSKSVGVLTEGDVLESKSEVAQEAQFRSSKNIYGAGFFDDIGKFLKGAVRPIIDTVGPVISAARPDLAPAVAGADQLAKSFGLGLGQVRGGAILDRKQLRGLK